MITQDALAALSSGRALIFTVGTVTRKTQGRSRADPGEKTLGRGGL